MKFKTYTNRKKALISIQRISWTCQTRSHVVFIRLPIKEIYFLMDIKPPTLTRFLSSTFIQRPILLSTRGCHIPAVIIRVWKLLIKNQIQSTYISELRSRCRWWSEPILQWKWESMLIWGRSGIPSYYGKSFPKIWVNRDLNLALPPRGTKYRTNVRESSSSYQSSVQLVLTDGSRAAHVTQWWTRFPRSSASLPVCLSIGIWSNHSVSTLPRLWLRGDFIFTTPLLYCMRI